jgi:hypothetical protein
MAWSSSSVRGGRLPRGRPFGREHAAIDRGVGDEVIARVVSNVRPSEGVQRRLHYVEEVREGEAAMAVWLVVDRARSRQTPDAEAVGLVVDEADGVGPWRHRVDDRGHRVHPRTAVLLRAVLHQLLRCVVDVQDHRIATGGPLVARACRRSPVRAGGGQDRDHPWRAARVDLDGATPGCHSVNVDVNVIGWRRHNGRGKASAR